MPTRGSGGTVVLAVLALVVLAGCTTLGPVGDGSAEEDPVERFVASYTLEDVSELHGVQTVVVEGENDTVKHTEEHWERPFADYRSEVLDSSEETRVEDVYVTNETTTWWYDAETNEASVEETEPYDDREVEAAREDVANEQLEYYNFSVEGSDTVADRETTVIELDATNESVAEGPSVLVGDTEFVLALETVETADEFEVVEQRLWLDDETDFPVKERVTFETLRGETVVMTQRYEDLSLDPDLTDEHFAYEPPENASIGGPPGASYEAFETREDAEGAAPFSIPEPTVPEGYALDEVVVQEYGADVTIDQVFADGDGSPLHVVVSDAEAPVDDPVEEDVGSVDGVVFQTTLGTAIQWECPDDRHGLVNGDLSEEELLTAAESVDCSV